MAWSAKIAILIVCLSSAATALVPYLIAVTAGHVDPLLPHIAATGDSAPESTLFTQLAVVTDAFFLFIVQVRYVQVAVVCESNAVQKFYRAANLFSCCVGYVTGSGLLVLACFQACNALVVHAVASLLFSAGCLLYVLLQTILSRRIGRYVKSEGAVPCRIALAVLIFFFMSMYLTGIVWTNWECSTANNLRASCRKNPLWSRHLLSSTSERALLILYIAYLLTFWREFEAIKITSTKIEVLSHRGEPLEGT